jgi:prolipoprotein diacylglyceryltransferase
MVFPLAGDTLPRHPVQFYHIGLEGIALFLLLWFFAKKERPEGVVSAVFLIGYGVCRFITEFFRAPDLGISDQFYAADMSQGMTLLMLLLGAGMFALAYRHQRGPALAIPGALLFGYGAFRALVWVARAPEGIFSLSTRLSMGQCLSLPMIALGLLMLWMGYSRHTAVTGRIRALLNFDFGAPRKSPPPSP